MSLDLDLIYPEFNLKVDKPNGYKIYEFEKFRLDADHLMLYFENDEVPLVPKAVKTLLVLVERRGEIVSKDELMDAVWTDAIVEESNLWQYLHLLRKTLGNQANGQPFIETLRRRGYRFNGDVRTIEKTIESIAVLPFENTTGNTDLDYLSDGLSESVIERLSALPQVKVIARASSFKYRGHNFDLQDAATKLGARAIVMGRITQRGENIVIRVQMIDVWENRELWGEQFKRSATDALAIEEEIARTASEKLRLKLTGAETERLAKNYTDNSEAYQLYLRGRFLYKKFTLTDTLKAIEYYDQAIALDPKFALAYDAHANATAYLMNFPDSPPLDYKQLTRKYTLKALEIDDQLAEARTSYAGMLPGFDYDFAGGEREFRRAIELNPNHADAHFWYGQLLSNLGRHEEALAEIRRGEELNPVSLETHRYKADILFYARRYDESIAEAKKSVELDANFAPAYLWLAIAYRMKGDYEASVAGLIKFFELRGAPENAEAIRKSFEQGRWEGFVHDATAGNPPFKVSPYFAATLCAISGQTDKAFAILNQLYEKRSPQLVVIKVDPRLDNLRGDPRFADLLRRVGLPQ